MNRLAMPVLLAALLSLVVSCAHAEPAPDLINPVGGVAKPADGKGAADVAISPDSTVDEVLDVLDVRGKGLKAFTAKVSLKEEDNVGLSNTRTGRVAYDKSASGDNARMRVSFDKRENGDRVLEEKVEYLLDGSWLIDRDYKRKIEVKRQVLKPGEKVNLLKLGGGPFPLPIGQDKAEVHKLFDVTKEPVGDDDSLKGTAHVKLIPGTGTQFARKFSAIEVWVDPKTNFPRRIDTTDAAGNNFRTTTLDDLVVNPEGGLTEKDFALPPVDDKEWERSTEPYAE